MYLSFLLEPLFPKHVHGMKVDAVVVQTREQAVMEAAIDAYRKVHGDDRTVDFLKAFRDFLEEASPRK